MIESGLYLKPNDEVERILNIPIPNILDILLQYSLTTYEGTYRRGIEIPWEDEVIWGATATILKQLFHYFPNNSG
jgi:hypothetical protein